MSPEGRALLVAKVEHAKSMKNQGVRSDRRKQRTIGRKPRFACPTVVVNMSKAAAEAKALDEATNRGEIIAR